MEGMEEKEVTQEELKEEVARKLFPKTTLEYQYHMAKIERLREVIRAFKRTNDVRLMPLIIEDTEPLLKLFEEAVLVLVRWSK